MVEDRYAQLHADFRWQVPDDFNIAEACCGRWARDTPKATAIHFDSDSGCRAQYSYAQLQRAANRLSNALLNQGVRRGHRVAIVLPQRFETAVAHIAIQQIGAVAMPLSMLFGAEALEYRLQDSGAVLAIAACEALPGLREVKARCPALRRIVVVGECPASIDPACDELPWMQALQAEEARFKPVATQADDAAILIYTSGTTGNPKGALIPQRALMGNLTGFVASQNWFGFDPFDASQPSDAVFWSPADWAWTGGLMDALLPTLYFGRPIVAFQGRFAPAKAFELMATYGVTHAFLFPTALKAMMKAEPRPQRHKLKLRALMSAGEAVGDAVFTWCRDALGVPVNEMFGQTEVNYVVGNCQALWPAQPGSMGRAYPGHRVAVIDDDGQECAPGQTGEVAVHARDRHGVPDPVFFLGYWNNEAATKAKFTGDPADSWCRTGDLARMDADGTLWYEGRADDVFKSAGYRIGPGEIENCLLKHPAVANAAVVPKPDAERGALVKAYVVLAEGHKGDAALVAALQGHVKARLAPYEYPKEIEFIDALPMTTTGKVQRRVLRLREQAAAVA
ncbi:MULTISPECIES: acyl-CoA synthetase [unclassified Roseateles]|uniref:acyl-CoA synthetase n=1 Tax=unclassified Roseateles TaxID=2626991 RepID=UPI0006F80570|nr:MULTISPECIES: AMP-binding protein [unclassified Roseateles]KQW52053.1 AMP-binding protein [Pelomonas sp. Root405]KRA78287.1 AMP-binding protein [Pelomonas sp. Root662]